MNRVEHSKKFRINQPVDILFPLFSAEGEKLWVPGWDYENIMGTTKLHEDYIFVTRTHDHAASEAVWLVKKYDPESHFIQLYKVEPGDKVGIITAACTRVEERLTEVEVTYQYIGLGDAGNAFIDGFTQDFYENFIGEWERLLNTYFASGACA